MSFVEWLWTIGSVGSLIALAVVLVDTELIYFRIRSQRDDPESARTSQAPY